MTDEAKDHQRYLHQCPACGFHYQDQETADRCHDWCSKHSSCNLAITAQALENRKPGS